MQQRGDAQLVQLFRREPQLLADQRRILRHSAGVTARVRILFVDGRGKHSNGTDKQLTVFLGGFLQALDVFLDVAGHLVEVFSELADFRSAAPWGALVKFAAADSASGGRQPANWPADTHREEISDENGGQNDDADECQGLPVEFGHPGVRLRLIETPLPAYRPIHLGETAVGSDLLDRVFLVLLGKAHGFRVAKLLRQSFDSRNKRIATDSRARNEV